VSSLNWGWEVFTPLGGGGKISLHEDAAMDDKFLTNLAETF